ncbi:MAG: sodium:solute symporter family protein, partial [Lawsonibacter sp.]
GRLAVLGGGTLSMLLTLNPPAFTLSYGGDLWGVVSILFFPPLYGTLLTKKVTRNGVWACILVGGAAIAVLYPAYYSGALTAHPAMFGVVLSSAAMFLVSALDRRREGVKK